jgi:hypothetical protein
MMWWNVLLPWGYRMINKDQTRRRVRKGILRWEIGSPRHEQYWASKDFKNIWIIEREMFVTWLCSSDALRIFRYIASNRSYFPCMLATHAMQSVEFGPYYLLGEFDVGGKND